MLWRKWRIRALAARERAHVAGRERVPEPMLMNDPEAVAQFHAGGTTNPGLLMGYDFSARALNALLPEGGRLLDLGCGSGRALAYLVRGRPDLDVTGVDLAPNMLATARELFEAEGLDGRIKTVEADITALPDAVVERPWDAISCVWTLHQLPDFAALRAALRQIAAAHQRTGAAVWIFDFQRLRDARTLPALLAALDPPDKPVLRRDAIASEAAGFTYEELSIELKAVGLGELRSGVARPIPWLQAFWTPPPGGRPTFQADRLPRFARGPAAKLRSGFTARPF